MHTIALFNHKGGVGKTTLAVNVGEALAGLGLRVLLVDADPQCNLTAFYLDEKQLDELLGESDDVNGGTLWSAIKPVIEGKGPIRDIEPFEVGNELYLCAGDVLLADYEEELPAAWTGSFARKGRDYDVMCALSRAVRRLAKTYEVDLVIYDVGPNVGPLNRTVLLDADYFATPVAEISFRYVHCPLSTVGRSVARWVRDWKTVRDLAAPDDQKRLLLGHPVYLGYIASAYKVASGRLATRPHEYWEAKIPRHEFAIVL